VDTGQIVTLILGIVGVVSTGFGVLFRALIQSHRDTLRLLSEVQASALKDKEVELIRWRDTAREWQDRAWLAVSDVAKPAVEAARNQSRR
jgi:hypothetical protein